MNISATTLNLRPTDPVIHPLPPLFAGATRPTPIICPEPPITILPIDVEPPITILPMRATSVPTPGTGPVGAATYGRLLVDYALNGTPRREFGLRGPVIPPALTAASYEDAIAGVQRLLADDRHSGNAFAITSYDGRYMAHLLDVDAEAYRVLNSNGKAPGVASWKLADTRDHLAAIVTIGNVIKA